MKELVPAKNSLDVAADPSSSDLRDTLRAMAKQRRLAAYRELGPYAGELLKVHFQEKIELARNAVIAGYWPVRDEIDPRPIMHTLHANDYAICLPIIITQGAPLLFRQWQPDMQLQPGQFEIPIPPGQARELTPDIILTPCVAFDRFGHRLGMKGGFYDRTLEFLRAEKTITAIGLAYSAQEAAQIPFEAHDQRLDAMVTERGVDYFPR